MVTLPNSVTNGEKYLPVINTETEDEAAKYFEVCVQHSISAFGKTRHEAEKHERKAIAVAVYYGFHCDDKTIERVTRLFHIENEIKALE